MKKTLDKIGWNVIDMILCEKLFRQREIVINYSQTFHQREIGYLFRFSLNKQKKPRRSNLFLINFPIPSNFSINFLIPILLNLLINCRSICWCLYSISINKNSDEFLRIANPSFPLSLSLSLFSYFTYFLYST